MEIARALLHRPGLIVLDEPTSGLDPTARAAVWTDLLRLRNELGVTILFATHYMDEAEYADDEIRLRAREMSADAPAPTRPAWSAQIPPLLVLSVQARDTGVLSEVLQAAERLGHGDRPLVRSAAALLRAWRTGRDGPH